MAILLENAIFPTPVYFAPPLKGFPLELRTGAGVKKLEWGATGPNKKFDDIVSRVDTMHQRDIVSRGINSKRKAEIETENK